MTTHTAQAISQHSAFEHLRTETIESLNIEIQEYQHKVTQAMHYHFATPNDENVFLVALRTVPHDSSGVAHILEHTALCGSKRYPVRDPFFMMIRRSLNTFMNAFTSSDWTAYPFASQNKKDFQNLLDVYLDAVFFSNLHHLDFLQEGHRLEFENPEDSSSNLLYKGVVFNEMKGSMGSPINTLWQTLSKYLFPESTYHFNSGGEPEDIPNLSYEALQKFYKTHYHPSNAVFMTYGDIPAEKHHENFETLALKQFKRSDAIISVDNEKRYKAPLVVEEFYAIDSSETTEDKTHIVLGWLLGESTNLETQLKAYLLSGVLLDNSASPLMHALETSLLGNAPSPLCGVEDSNKEITFICGLDGSNPEHAIATEKLILDVLNKVAEQGIPLEQVEAVLHQLELEQREVGGAGYPYGLQLILEALPSAVHFSDPCAALNLDPVLEKLRTEIQDPEFIKNLIKEQLLNNQHRVRLSLKPDTALSERRDQEEVARLASIKQALSQSQTQKIIDLSKQLSDRQAQLDDENMLPKVGIEDIPDKMHISQGSQAKIDSFQSTIYNEATNGIVYQQAIFDLPKLDEELIAVLPYYTYCLTELGCNDKSYLDTQAWQARVSGGISTFTSIRGKVEDIQDVSAYLFLSGKALAKNTEALTELMHDTFTGVRFDEFERIRELLAQQKAHREQSVLGSGHQLAMGAASSGFSPTSLLRHKLSGLEGIKYIKQLDKQIVSNEYLETFVDKLQRIHQHVLHAQRQFVIIGEDENLLTHKNAIRSYWGDTASNNLTGQGFSLPHTMEKVKQAWITSTPVNFCAKAYPTVPSSHEDAPIFSVLSGFLRNGFLHTAIREKGGAYGGGASYMADNATFRFYSYRDPRLQETLDEFDQSIDWLLSNEHSNAKLEEAILGVISSMDKPSSPAGEAKDAFQNLLFNRTEQHRQAYRSRILNVSIDDLKRVAETYLKTENESIAIITNSTNMEKLPASDYAITQL